MKIIGTDNFSRDYVSDFLVCSDVNEYYGKIIVDQLNEMNGQTGPTYFQLVPDDHKLYIWEP